MPASIPFRRAPGATHPLHVVEENERHRLAEVLHDGVGQILSLCRMKLDLLSHELSHTAQAAELASIRGLLDRTIDETHTLIGGTSPVVLQEDGLAVALRKLGQVFRQTYGLEVRVVSPAGPGPDHAPANVRTVLYSAVRELLTNARKYSRAQQVTIRLREVSSQLWVRVTDNGRGFDPAQTGKGPARQGGFGLRNIRRRCEQIGAQFCLRSAPRRGTQATITVPLRPPRPSKPRPQPTLALSLPAGQPELAQ